MDRWQQLGQLLASNDPHEDRLKASAMQSEAPMQGSPMVDPSLIEYWANKAGYRGNMGIHPDSIGGAPGIKLQIQDDSQTKPDRVISKSAFNPPASFLEMLQQSKQQQEDHSKSLDMQDKASTVPTTSPEFLKLLQKQLDQPEKFHFKTPGGTGRGRLRA